MLFQLELNPYDVLVLDRDLPGIHGDTICRTITAACYRVMILMLTAAGVPGDRVTGMARRADDYLPKPFHFPELVLRIRALARGKPAARPRTSARGRDRARPAAPPSPATTTSSTSRSSYAVLEPTAACPTSAPKTSSLSRPGTRTPIRSPRPLQVTISRWCAANSAPPRLSRPSPAPATGSHTDPPSRPVTLITLRRSSLAAVIIAEQLSPAPADIPAPADKNGRSAHDARRIQHYGRLLILGRSEIVRTNNNALFVALRNCEERCRLRTSGRRGQRIRALGRTTAG